MQWLALPPAKVILSNRFRRPTLLAADFAPVTALASQRAQREGKDRQGKRRARRAAAEAFVRQQDGIMEPREMCRSY